MRGWGCEVGGGGEILLDHGREKKKDRDLKERTLNKEQRRDEDIPSRRNLINGSDKDEGNS